uniref:S-protein homolog n=1 Tax=Cucumis melo TaxID=3656 RepID=A0A9I9E4G9_CUCME
MYFVHVVNGLSYHCLDVHCQSKDDDLRYRHLVDHGDDFQWNFEENFWGTTLFWCRSEKSNAYVAFESFWPESSNHWLHDTCENEGTCIWIAK